MDGSGLAPSVDGDRALHAYDGPPDHRAGMRHDVYPDLTHDEVERFNFLAQMNRHLATRVLPLVDRSWESRVEPAFEAEHRREPINRSEARKALLADPIFQIWSALKRMTMEQRQQAGRWASIRQAETLAERADALLDEAHLTLDPSVRLPRYVSAVDHHCMPGSYHAELFPGDVSGPANYDSGIHVTMGGRGGPYNDRVGRAVADWMKANLKGFEPRRIIDLGVTTGHNLLPIARAFPKAEVVGVDVGVPVLRYAAARAKALGVNNVRFIQADAADLAQFEDGRFDFVMSTMFLHELSLASLGRVFREAYRLLSPGGVMLNMEQPSYKGMSVYEQTMRDWDAFYNNEPFWTTLHDLNLDDQFLAAGFLRDKLIHVTFDAPQSSTAPRKIAMVFVGARK